MASIGFILMIYASLSIFGGTSIYGTEAPVWAVINSNVLAVIRLKGDFVFQ